VFSIESFMDELAKAAGADPVEFRLLHLEDARARDVIRAAAERFGWSSWRPQPGRGRGFAFARYKNLAGYAAIALEIEAQRDTGLVRVLRAVAAVDCGEAVNPDGIRNQLEGGIIQGASWVLKEQVRFDNGVASFDWETYPVLKFSEVPEIDIELINTRDEVPLGAGEVTGGPTAAAIGNAVSNALGARIREMPLTRERIMAALLKE